MYYETFVGSCGNRGIFYKYNPCAILRKPNEKLQAASRKL